ncbi:hypothetical protein MTX78_20135 [Hymenobacter tibetensis]|uniref:PEGA domain-containing protein n=1 Tax=Hymenobacter tibetensis TaxID=497967 RepID=A0ABY4CWF3_9BACT|nr:hypothetical protein [Hymenobacter tibetensis]UOG74416.1 hypothetical protein MTX78_20135 [Hymenobacter tibetensis]
MKVTLPFALAATLLLGSCASIVSKSRYPVVISSVPAGANFTVTNRDGKEVFSGVAPTAVTLKSGSGYMRREIYTLTFKKEGFEDKKLTLESDVNGWYFGNIVFGGLIGFLIVDPLTGAMYRISDKEIQGALSPIGQGFNPTDTHPLHIMSLNDVPDALRSKMVPVE